MDLLFVKVLNMSISASWLVLIVLVLRLLLKKAPRWIRVALWALVAVRLVCPVSLESVFSLIPSTQTVPEEIFYLEPPLDNQNTTLEILQPRPNGEAMDVELDATVSVVQTKSVSWAFIWPTGMAVMVLYALISYLRLKRKVSASIDVGNGVYICDYIDTPFILGIVKPKIYLPSAMEPASASHVLAHERAHIARKDHWWKPLGYGLLCAYWFNPVLWLAYILLCRDIELACDEKVIRDMAVPEKKAYSEALLSCSVSRRSIAACPLAFGEVGVKERVKTVLNYRKPAFWIVLVAVLALIVTAVCFLTDPVQWSEDKIALWFEEYAFEKVSGRMDREEVRCIAVQDDFALIYCQGEGPSLILYQFEQDGSKINILGTCTGEYTLSGGMSLNHVESGERHIYFGTISEYHYNPIVDLNTWLNWDYLSITDEKGKDRKQDMTGKDGFLFVLDAPMADFQAVDGLGTECLNVKKFTEQGYYMVEAVFESGKSSPTSNPHSWTSTVKASDIQKAWAYPNEDAAYLNTIEGSRLGILLTLLNAVQENEIVARKPSGEHDPLWNNAGTSVNLYCTDDMSVFLRYVDDTVIIGTETESGTWEVDGYWVIENENLTNWLERIANGGTHMLSDENREEVRQLLRMEQVQLFDPWEYGGLLFVGCAYDHGRGLGIAVYEPLDSGYHLLKLIRGEEVKRCASGFEVYYCDYDDARIFLILNESITGMEWAGAYENAYSIDTHPGLVVEYFPENLDAMYRFNYGGGTTMYMDRNDKTHVQPPKYAADAFVNPEDAYHICSNLKLSDVVYAWASDSEKVDDSHERAITKDLTDHQMVQLISLLHGLPETAFENAAYPTEGIRYLNLFTEEPLTPPYLELKVHEENVYFRFYTDLQTAHQDWIIHSDELRTLIESFYGGDTSNWNRFAPYPVEEGEISFTHGDWQITVPRLLCFQYGHTEKGIRFKPQDQSGWLEFQYRNEPYAPDKKGLSTLGGKYAGYDAIYGYNSYCDSWSYLEITMPNGENTQYLLLLNDDGQGWVEAYGWEIRWMIDHLAAVPAG